VQDRGPASGGRDRAGVGWPSSGASSSSEIIAEVGRESDRGGDGEYVAWFLRPNRGSKEKERSLGRGATVLSRSEGGGNLAGHVLFSRELLLKFGLGAWRGEGKGVAIGGGGKVRGKGE